MIDFHKPDLSKPESYNAFLQHCGERGCEYSLANLTLWGRQKVAFVHGCLAFFSQYERRSIYPFPIGDGDIQAVLEAIIHDSQTRGIGCRLTGMTAADCATLEELYPGKFRYHPDRTYSDYIYSIENLANLPGRKYQRKRNHLNRFRQAHPDCEMVCITPEMFPQVQKMLDLWYESRLDPEAPDDFHLEQVALHRAFEHWDELSLEGAVLMENGSIFAMAIGSRINEDTFDVHFEKALDSYDGAYAAINQGFSAHLHQKYPALRWLNREDDMGLPGLRKAKLSYCPDRLLVKFWADLWEDEDEH